MTLPPDIPLGKQSEFPTAYDPGQLFPVARTVNREKLGVSGELPFTGYDHWRGYELSWLSASGKPVAAMLDIMVPCDSPNLIESKSMKLYLNSLNQHMLPSAAAAEQLIAADLSTAAGCPVTVIVTPLSAVNENRLHTVDPFSRHDPAVSVVNLDALNVDIETYQPSPALLAPRPDADMIVSEILVSDLFRSNCPITAQPDWGSVCIRYTGRAISHQSVLAYLVSYRLHEGFHEHCVEQIYCDIQQVLKPEQLSVAIYFTRRGGLEINPLRVSYAVPEQPLPRLLRQ